jgi:AcrR family transcriptional regulator
MASDQTRTSILSAAERLYAERGFGDVTLRDIVAAAGVNLAAVNYHFGSKDELIAELFVTRSLATNRERLNELKAAEAAGGGRASIDSILRALVGPTLRGCLGPERERSTAARFMIRASIESVPPIRRIRNREIDHLRKFAAAMRRSLPDRDEVDFYWGLHFALAMAHQTIRDSERLTKLSEGLCDLNDVEGIIDRIVAVSVMALTGGDCRAAGKIGKPDPTPLSWTRAFSGWAESLGHSAGLMVRDARRCRAPHRDGSNEARHARHSGPASPARAHAIVPGIHVLAGFKRERRGWPGRARP